MSDQTATDRRTAKRAIPWRPILLVAVAIYAVLLVLQNTRKVEVDFVFFTAETSVIVLVLLSMVLGLVLAALAVRIRQKRKKPD